jgi:translation initiation factor IF-3
LVDPETGRLNPPVELRDILSQLDLREYSVELVSAGPTPIVKVINKRETYEKNKERKARARQQMEQKEIQLTWGIASQDLTHKLKKVRAVLERGGRVDLVYAPRKGQPLPTKEGMHARVEETMDILTDVGKEWKPREIKKAVTALYLQGKTKQS